VPFKTFEEVTKFERMVKVNYNVKQKYIEFLVKEKEKWRGFGKMLTQVVQDEFFHTFNYLGQGKFGETKQPIRDFSIFTSVFKGT
jgi:hypothetical protein